MASAEITIFIMPIYNYLALSILSMIATIPKGVARPLFSPLALPEYDAETSLVSLLSGYFFNLKTAVGRQKDV